MTTAERVRALTIGAPAWSLRRRSIETLEEGIGAELFALRSKGKSTALADLPTPTRRRLERLNRLIVDHNRYYPIEANLPIDPATGQLVDRGQIWTPLPSHTVDSLLARLR